MDSVIFFSEKVISYGQKHAFLEAEDLVPPSATNLIQERKFAKIQAGYDRIFMQKYERYMGKNTSADSQLFNFQK